MASQTDEETDLQLSSREGRIYLIEKWLIPLLDSPNWDDEFETTPNSVKESANSLAKEYHDLATPMIYSTAFLVLSLFVVDYLLYLHPQVYGLFLNVWSGLFFAFPSLKGRFVISTIVDSEDKEALRMLEAQDMASNNVGIGLLACGFLVQMLSVQFISEPEFITENVAGEVLPSWTVAILLALAFLIGGKSLSWLRDKRLSQRKETSE